MPVILSPADYDAWLDPATTDATKLSYLFEPFPAAEMVTRAVNPVIYSVHDEGQDCLPDPKACEPACNPLAHKSQSTERVAAHKVTCQTNGTTTTKPIEHNSLPRIFDVTILDKNGRVVSISHKGEFIVQAANAFGDLWLA